MKLRNLLLPLIATLAMAEVAIEPLALTYHYDTDKKYNSKHDYLGIVYRDTTFDYSVATFVNSHYNRTYTASISYRYSIYKYDEVDVQIYGALGVQYGYFNYPVRAWGGLHIELDDSFYVEIVGAPAFIGTKIGFILF